MARRRRGHPQSPATRAKIAASLRGRHRKTLPGRALQAHDLIKGQRDKRAAGAPARQAKALNQAQARAARVRARRRGEREAQDHLAVARSLDNHARQQRRAGNTKQSIRHTKQLAKRRRRQARAARKRR